jgi:hypothetical protein
MTPEKINKLADQFSLSNGLVNYLLLFRTYLSDIGGNQNSLMKARSMSALPASDTGSKVHPWDFGYQRDRHSRRDVNHQPYWQQASSVPKPAEDTKRLSLKFTMIPSATEKSAEQLSAVEQQQLLAQFQPGVLQLCRRCYRMFAPIWRPLRNACKKQQIPTQKGSILTTHFVAILEENGITLRNTELGVIVKNFRGAGMQDIVRYDDFMRVCMLVKDRNDLSSTPATSGH